MESRSGFQVTYHLSKIKTYFMKSLEFVLSMNNKVLEALGKSNEEHAASWF